METLIQADKELFLFLNGIHSPVFDQVMWWFSAKTVWIPLYLVILFAIFRRDWKIGIITLIFIVLGIVFADMGSVHLFKNVFMRLRPCHDETISELVHLVRNKCGGQYGFISSHAANTFSFAMFTSLWFKINNYGIAIFIWALIVSYSRIYLGVHFPCDVIVGAIFGVICGSLSFLIYRYTVNYYKMRTKSIDKS